MIRNESSTIKILTNICSIDSRSIEKISTWYGTTIKL